MKDRKVVAEYWTAVNEEGSTAMLLVSFVEDDPRVQVVAVVAERQKINLLHFGL